MLLPNLSQMQELRSKQQLGEVRAMVRAVQHELREGMAGMQEEMAELKQTQMLRDEAIQADLKSIGTFMR